MAGSDCLRMCALIFARWRRVMVPSSYKLLMLWRTEGARSARLLSVSFSTQNLSKFDSFDFLWGDISKSSKYESSASSANSDVESALISKALFSLSLSLSLFLSLSLSLPPSLSRGTKLFYSPPSCKHRIVRAGGYL